MGTSPIILRAHQIGIFHNPICNYTILYEPRIVKRDFDPSSVVVLGKFRRFHFPILSICSPEPRFFPYLLQIFNALSELFLLKKIFRYVIIIVLYRTFSEGGYGLLFKKRKEEKRDIFTNV